MVKHWFDKKCSSSISFQKGDLILKWDEERSKPKRHKKIDSLSLLPCIIVWEIQTNAYDLEQMDGQIILITINEQHLKHNSVM